MGGIVASQYNDLNVYWRPMAEIQRELPAMITQEYHILRIMMHCMRMTPTKRRLITTFHMRCPAMST